MKISIITLLFFSFTFHLHSQNNMEELIPDTFVIGNFDADKILDTAQLWVPRGHNIMYGCEICNTEIRFSNGTKTIHHKGDVGFRLENVGDLNWDGTDDIAYCRDWYMGCRRTFEIYLVGNKEWIIIDGMEFMACGDERGLKSRIKVLDKRKIKLEGEETDGTPRFRIVELNGSNRE